MAKAGRISGRLFILRFNYLLSYNPVSEDFGHSDMGQTLKFSSFFDPNGTICDERQTLYHQLTLQSF
jgi:hypothetical protein